MFKQVHFRKTYKALGFMEALISIIVAGIASILLMGIAIDTVKQLIKTDQSDEMTQYAIEGGEILKNIAQKNDESPTALFPSISGNQNSCFELNESLSTPSFVSNGDGSFTSKCNYDGGQRAQCAQGSQLGGQYFRVFCISNSSDVTSGLVVGKLIVGKATCDLESTCDIADYEYYVLTKTLQR